MASPDLVDPYDLHWPYPDVLLSAKVDDLLARSRASN